MKASILRTLITVAISAVLSSVGLQAQDRIRVTIPFDFNVGSTLFPAGEYSVTPVMPGSPILEIQRSDGNSAVLAQTFNGSGSPVPGLPRLTFNRYGDHYFLSKVAGDGHGWELPKSPVERELIAKFSARSRQKM